MTNSGIVGNEDQPTKPSPTPFTHGRSSSYTDSGSEPSPSHRSHSSSMGPSSVPRPPIMVRGHSDNFPEGLITLTDADGNARCPCWTCAQSTRSAESLSAMQATSATAATSGSVPTGVFASHIPNFNPTRDPLGAQYITMSYSGSLVPTPSGLSDARSLSDADEFRFGRSPSLSNGGGWSIAHSSSFLLSSFGWSLPPPALTPRHDLPSAPTPKAAPQPQPLFQPTPAPVPREVYQHETISAPHSIPTDTTEPPATGSEPRPIDQANVVTQQQQQQNLDEMLLSERERSYCGLCKMDCWTEPHLEKHFRGKYHNRKLRQLLRRSVTISQILSEIPLDALSRFFDPLALDVDVPPVFISAVSDAAGPSQHVTFVSSEHAEQALGYSGQELMGSAVEIRPSLSSWECAVCETAFNSLEQYDQHVAGAKHQLRFQVHLEQCTVRVERLPFLHSDEAIHNFFAGFAIIPGGIQQLFDSSGSSVAIAYVTFESPELAEQAVLRWDGCWVDGVRASIAKMPSLLAEESMLMMGTGSDAQRSSSDEEEDVEEEHETDL